jgi:RNA polymerase sigma-70 factor (ECF subfamily)
LLKAITERWQRRPTAAPDARALALRAGHPAVIEEVLLELTPRIRGWCYRRVGARPVLDDIVQEVLIELARALPRFDGHSSLPTYAYRICSRVTWRQLKKSRSEPPAAELPGALPSPDDDPERIHIERQALEAVLACLSRLPERRREAFILCELEGETPEHAARMLGTTPNAVRSRLMHARRELERRLRGHDVLSALRGER